MCTCDIGCDAYDAAACVFGVFRIDVYGVCVGISV